LLELYRRRVINLAEQRLNETGDNRNGYVVALLERLDVLVEVLILG
jgi:hypothetical protein